VYLVLGVGVLVLVLGDDVLGVLVCWCAGVGVLMSDVLVCWCVYVYVIYTRALTYFMETSSEIFSFSVMVRVYACAECVRVCGGGESMRISPLDTWLMQRFQLSSFKRKPSFT
jgi:hypothetical protein